MEGHYVGILVNERLFRRIPSGKTKHESVKHYVEAGKELGITPCFFRIQDFRTGAMSVPAFVWNNNGAFVRKTVPAPQVIHNRAIYTGARRYRRLRSWGSNGIVLFNPWNRYGKQRIHNCLMKEPGLRPHLPSSFKATADNVRAMMDLYDTLIIKPNKSSVGLGVMKLERKKTGWRWLYPVRTGVLKQIWRNLRFRGPVLPARLRRMLRSGGYIVQQHLPLATFKDRPFDLRVSVQRDASGEWQVTGITAKVAAPKKFLTNIAQGGQVYRLEHIITAQYPHLQTEDVEQEICDFSLQVARCLGAAIPYMADLGIDIGITVNGFPMLIECNAKDQRYSFHKAGMYKEWRAAYFNPMAYAKYLLDNSLV